MSWIIYVQANENTWPHVLINNISGNRICKTIQRANCLKTLLLNYIPLNIYFKQMIKISAKMSNVICEWRFHCICTFVCLFGCVEFIVPLKNFSLIWRRHHCRLKAANFDLCSALMAIEQWGFFNVPHLLWHGSTLYNDHLRGPVTVTPVAERLAVELSPPDFTTWVCRDRGSNPTLPHAMRTLYLYATAAVAADRSLAVASSICHNQTDRVGEMFPRGDDEQN